MKEHTLWISRVFLSLGESLQEMAWASANPIGGDLSYSAVDSRASIFLHSQIFQLPHCHSLSAAFESSLFSFVSSLFAYLGRNEEGPCTSRHPRWLRSGQVTPFLAKAFWAEIGDMTPDMISPTFWQINRGGVFISNQDKRANREAAVSEELTTKGFCSHTAPLVFNLGDSRTHPWSYYRQLPATKSHLLSRRP